jgi:hypothetical protein
MSALNHEVMSAVRYALSDGRWRMVDLIAVLRGPARHANGSPVACCEECGCPEYGDGLYPTESTETDDGVPIVSGFLCGKCMAQKG